MLKKWLKEFHWPLIFSKFALAFIGILFIYSASHFEPGQYAFKQIFWVSIGFMAFFIVAKVGYRTFLGSSYLLYTISVLLLIWVLFKGETRLGAQRWIHLGFFALQPSEFAKLATVMALANFLGSCNSWEKGTRVILTAFAMVLLPMILVLKQPDLGSSLIFVPILVFALFIWGIKYRYLIITFITGIVATPFLWMFLKEYQKKRILVFMNPDQDPLGAGYTAMQSRIAVGSGGLLGKGYLAGTQSQLQFVPEHHTDFIFCVLGEEWGFIGSLLLLILFGILFQSIFYIMEQTTDIKAKLLASGVLAAIFTQAFINIGMTFGIMPITGITLPLLSYGGSSFVATSIALGLVLSIYKERSIF